MIDINNVRQISNSAIHGSVPFQTIPAEFNLDLDPLRLPNWPLERLLALF